MKSYCVYIMASKRNGTLYTGVTRDLVRRGFEHRTGALDGLTKKYGIHMLVWCEEHHDVSRAIQREKNIKHWSRKWKLELIESSNPEWEDLYEKIWH